MRLVLVEWLDAEGGIRSGWRPVKDMSREPVPCKSVGWLKDDDDNMLLVIPHLGTAGNEHIGDGEIRIPKGWATKITDLIEKKRRR